MVVIRRRVNSLKFPSDISSFSTIFPLILLRVYTQFSFSLIFAGNFPHVIRKTSWYYVIFFSTCCVFTNIGYFKYFLKFQKIEFKNDQNSVIFFHWLKYNINDHQKYLQNGISFVLKNFVRRQFEVEILECQTILWCTLVSNGMFGA